MRMLRIWRIAVCLFTVVFVSCVSADKWFDPLAGASGANRVVVCVKTGPWFRRCPGVLVQKHWALARAGCVSRREQQQLYLMRADSRATCEDIEAGYHVYGARLARTNFPHPWLDLALVMADVPYITRARVANVTDAKLALKPHGVLKWMNQYFIRYKYPHKRVATRSCNGLHPLLVALYTFVLPIVLYALIYVYIITYTGHDKEDEMSLVTHMH